MDWGSHPYSAPCRYSSDPADPPGIISFYGSNLPALDHVTVFNNRWNETTDVRQFTLGLTSPTPRGYNGQWSSPGLIGGHVCGDPDWFLSGVPPGTPFLTRRGDGFPDCCPRALAGLAQMGLYPSSVLTVGPRLAPTGGLRIGGFVLTPAPVGPPPQGGLRIGGFVLDPVPVGPLPVGGFQLGGSVSPDIAGTLTLLVDSGGPLSFAAALTFAGSTGITLVTAGNQVTWTLGPVGPAYGVPTGLTATPGNTQITFNWTPPSGPTPTQYLLTVATNSTFTTGVQQFVLGAVTSDTVTGLTNGTQYWGQVASLNQFVLSLPSASATAAPPGYTISDTFTDTTGTNLTAHTIAPVNVPAASWSTPVGTWQIESNSAEQTGTANAKPGIAIVDAGNANLEVSVVATIPTPTAGHGVTGGVFGRYSDANNFWRFVFDSTGPDMWFLQKRVAGTFTTVLSASVSWRGTTQTLAMSFSAGNLITVFANGVSLGSTTDSFNSSATMYGLDSQYDFANGFTFSMIFNDFLVQ